METNIKEYIPIAISLSTYENRVRLYQAELDLERQQTIEKLKALGATDEDLAVLIPTY